MTHVLVLLDHPTNTGQCASMAFSSPLYHRHWQRFHPRQRNGGTGRLSTPTHHHG
ncbi:hypothetical protein HUT17_04905 (plasmid) [Nocardiopsis flavescens]|nr:hypothetical protein HUT17_04905 [Nocardiopsis flavescens]